MKYAVELKVIVKDEIFGDEVDEIPGPNYFWDDKLKSYLYIFKFLPSELSHFGKMNNSCRLTYDEAVTLLEDERECLFTHDFDEEQFQYLYKVTTSMINFINNQIEEENYNESKFVAWFEEEQI